ncbi:MAG: sporulation integral membrane protein YtvI [Thermotaleaceae bacterium]
MLKTYEKYLPIALKIVILFVCLTFLYYFGSTIISAILPFLVAWSIVLFIEPLMHVLKTKLKLSHTLATFISLSVFVGITLLIISIISGLIVVELIKFSATLPEYTNNLYEEATDIIEEIQIFYIQLPKDISQSILSSLNSLADRITSYISVILTSILSFISFVPEAFIFLIVTVIAAFFFAKDKEIIQTFALKHIKDSWRTKGEAIKQDLLLALVGYVKAQLILMCVTFTISVIGLSIIGIDYAIIIALVVSLVDALPILGTSAVYIPMAIWNILQGDYRMAVYIGILYLCAMTIRQMLEPKVLGNQIGLHPLITLISMYVGLKVFGVFGLIFGPVALVIGLAFYKMGAVTKTTEGNSL